MFRFSTFCIFAELPTRPVRYLLRTGREGVFVSWGVAVQFNSAEALIWNTSYFVLRTKNIMLLAGLHPIRGARENHGDRHAAVFSSRHVAPLHRMRIFSTSPSITRPGNTLDFPATIAHALCSNPAKPRQRGRSYPTPGALPPTSRHPRHVTSAAHYRCSGNKLATVRSNQPCLRATPSTHLLKRDIERRAAGLLHSISASTPFIVLIGLLPAAPRPGLRYVERSSIVSLG